MDLLLVSREYSGYPRNFFSTSKHVIQDMDRINDMWQSFGGLNWDYYVSKSIKYLVFSLSDALDVMTVIQILYA